ncbi:hypothetical protein [uncultured Paraglaciecola sp.]|uniref:hypothetical protein n=1 Tax=uncultured Paraglaciecola sp. TaxID=1765024 RepID=UPI0026251B02|nr:hypothetical protein [uncultured Paraglaciecola sp.]
MGINWEGAVAGLGAGIANTAQLMISAEVQAQRDARMAQYSQQSQQAGFAQQNAMQDRQLEAQGVMSQNKIAADQQKAMLEREQELSDMDRKEGHAFALASHKGAVNPSATNVTVNSGQDLDARTEEFSKAIGKADAETYESIRNEARSAVQMEDSLNVLEEMQSKFETGKTQEALAILGQYAGTDAGAAMQAWEGTISPIVLAKAEGLSGVLSDKDMEFLKASVPTFGNDKRANAVMIGLMRKGMQRAIENEKSMQEHLNEFGNLNNWSAPNQQGSGVNSTPAAQANMNAADDPLGLFSN